jgi:hypothetical protein
VFDLDVPDVELFNSLPDWIKEKIQKNLNYNGSVLQNALEGKGKPLPNPSTAVDAPSAAVDKEQQVSSTVNAADVVEDQQGADDKPWD